MDILVWTSGQGSETSTKSERPTNGYNNDYSSIINMKHSLLFLKLLALVLNFLDTLSDVKIKVFTLHF
jgi:hypothetical protein